MIEKKPKKCKGTSKAKGYGCGDKKFIYRYGLCQSCLGDWIYNTPEGKEVLGKSIIIGKKRVEKEAKEEFNKKKIENKSIASLIQDARRPFQKLIRIRDHGKMCICCDRPLPFDIGDYDGGHYFKCELYTGLIFNPNNVHGQTVHCNKHEHGNESGYSVGLINRIGSEKFNELVASKDALRQYSWDRHKLIEMKEYYNKELKLVEKGLKNISDVDLSIGIVKL
jgi:hypothetical protein